MEFANLFEKLITKLTDTMFPTFVKKRADGAKKIEDIQAKRPKDYSK
jgi:hypothetical protein